MKAKTKFKKVYYKLPEKARRELIYNPFYYPMSINICWHEIKNDTEKGKCVLKSLGFEDD